MPGTHVMSIRKKKSTAALPAMYSARGKRLRQVDLKRVGAPIVGDEAGADVDRHDEDEDVLLRQKIAEGLGRRREHRDLREVDREVDLGRAADELEPGHDAAGRGTAACGSWS